MAREDYPIDPESRSGFKLKYVLYGVLLLVCIMIGVAVGLDHVSGSFVRSANLIVLVAYSCAAGIFLFVLTLIIQRYLGSKDARDILNELLGKVLRKLHLA